MEDWCLSNKRYTPIQDSVPAIWPHNPVWGECPSWARPLFPPSAAAPPITSSGSSRPGRFRSATCRSSASPSWRSSEGSKTGLVCSGLSVTQEVSDDYEDRPHDYCRCDYAWNYWSHYLQHYNSLTPGEEKRRRAFALWNRWFPATLQCVVFFLPVAVSLMQVFISFFYYLPLENGRFFGIL